MSTKIQWFIPCYINTDDNSDSVICLEITDSIKNALSKNISEKKIEYGQNYNLRNFVPEDFESIFIKILPRLDFMSMIPYQSEERREMILKLQEMRLSGYGTVIDRYWGCKNVGEEPLLFITIDLLSKP